MAEQTFRSPGFFEQEIDLSQRASTPVGTPAGVIGTSQKGPAFVPVIVGSFADFNTKFGTLDPDRDAPYAVKEYLIYKDAVTFLRVLGAGSNDTASEISDSISYGTVSKAGFKVKSVEDTTIDGNYRGAVQFIVARHYVSASGEAVGFPIFTDNDSYSSLGDGDSTVNLLRGVILTTTGSRAFCLNWNTALTDTVVRNTSDFCTRNDSSGTDADKTFKLIISSSLSTYAKDDGLVGVRAFSASLDPANVNYIGRVLNTDPDKFQEQQHILYLDYAVEDEVAAVSNVANSIGIVSGSNTVNPVGLADKWRDSFGRFDSRYSTPRTPMVISQPFGQAEFDLFYFETLSDGEYGNDKLKISISNIRASTDLNDKYGSFDVQIRVFDDTDFAKEILESYPEVNINPNSDRYIAKMIGDKQVAFNFDALDPDERRLVLTGKFPNVSQFVRVQMTTFVELEEIPTDSMPFGFSGMPALKSSISLTDNGTGMVIGPVRYGDNYTTNVRIGTLTDTVITGAIVPPLPFTFKCTRGAVSSDGSYEFAGEAGKKEVVDSRIYWGTKFTRCPLTSSTTNAILDTNVGTLPNALIKAYTKMQGVSRAENLVSGSGMDVFNNNKFTMARVALYSTNTDLSKITGSANEHMIEAAYIRNGEPDGTNYTVTDGTRAGRITFATLIHSSAIKFNRFQDYSKFTMPFYGGFDGLNILSKTNRLMTDKAASTDLGGYAADTLTGGLGLYGTNDGSMSGKGIQNNVVYSYRTAIELMTDDRVVNTNLLVVPGIRDPFVTDFAMTRTRDYSMAMYIMDIQQYDEDANRLFDSDTARRDVRETAEQFEGRRTNNNYSATYFPDVYISDDVNNRSVKVASSVVALGALAYNDTVAYPWFAPAGFNRGALSGVVNTEVRLTAGDRDTLYDARINPIANFPSGGFVIFGQKTLQINKSALDRVNVRRMLLEVKRLVVAIAEKLLFEPNTPATRAKFVAQVAPILALVQSQQGIEKFSVIMDDTNNTQEDVEQNKVNGRIVVVPTRAVEFIAIDFIITNSGVLFL